MKRTTAILPLLLLLQVVAGIGVVQAEPRITVFAAAVTKPVMEEAAKAFEATTGVRVDLVSGGSGTLVSQMKIAKRGDIFIAASPDYMETAVRDGVVDPGSKRILAYLIPVIIVQSGNPKGITGLEDLTRPGISLAIGNPETVAIGLYAYEILEKNGLVQGVAPNVVTLAPDVTALETLVAMKKVDAIIGWDVVPRWNPGKVEAVYLKPDQVARLAYVPAAVATHARDPENARRFIAFLSSGQGRELFVKRGYAASETEVRKHAPKATIGGAYALPKGYRPPVK